MLVFPHLQASKQDAMILCGDTVLAVNTSSRVTTSLTKGVRRENDRELVLSCPVVPTNIQYLDSMVVVASAWQ